MICNGNTTDGKLNRRCYKMNNTKPEEFRYFIKLLMKNAPENYIPWLFPVISNNKAPDGIAISKRASKEIKENKGNWKADWARLTIDEAYNRLLCGKNVGLAARAEDDLIIVDIDDWNFINQAKETLTIKSRKRCGIHAFYFKNKECHILPTNIPTDYGELRSSDQYVVCSGSYCLTSNNDILKEPIPENMKESIINDEYLGVYTVFNNIPCNIISFNELPEFMKKRKFDNDNKQKIIQEKDYSPKKFNGEKSALYNLNIHDLISIHDQRRHPHPLHSSDTGMNFSIKDNLAHCWRHNVSINALQYLVVKSGYMGCLDAGTSHNDGGAGCSGIINDDGAIFHAWIEAKKQGIIPRDDKIPCRAMKYIAIKNKLIPPNYSGWKLPINVYNDVIKMVEGEY